MNQQKWVNVLCDHVRNVENTQPSPHNWPGKTEGSEAATRYPNMLAELAYDARWLYYMAEGAGVSNQIMAAVLEDGEDLTPHEIYGLTKHWNFLEARDYLCSVGYMDSPVLSMLDCSTNKGRWRLRKLELMMEEVKENKIEIYDNDLQKINRLLSDMRSEKIIPYAQYRVAANIVAQRLQWRRDDEAKKRKIRTSRRLGQINETIGK